jgi:hypothetical protein
MSVHSSFAARGARCWSQSRAKRWSAGSKLVPDMAHLAIDAAKPGLDAAHLAIDAAHLAINAAKTKLNAAYLASNAVNAKFNAAILTSDAKAAVWAKVWLMKSKHRSQGT